MAELPSKLFFRIGEVASLVGVEPHVLRYWEREFRSIRPTKSKKGQRVYSRRDVESLLRVRDLLYRDGFTIAGAKKQLQRGGVEPLSAEMFEVEPASEPSILAGASSAGPTSASSSVVGPALVSPLVTAATTAAAVATFEPRRAVTVAAAAEAPAREVVRPAKPAPDPRVREQLQALRAEVEAFLLELDGPAPAGG